ncbi:MAG: hypothetical protein WAT66_09715 [Actinomycetota bacterium]
MFRNRLAVLVGAAAVALPLFLQGSAPAAEAPPTFGSAVIVDPIHTFGEPKVDIAPDGTTYVHGPWGTGTQRSLWQMSTDGRVFKPLHDTAATSADDSVTTILGPGGGDTDVAIDRNGKVSYADLAALASLKVASWDPKTKTMESSVFAKGLDTNNGYDRQWLTMWDPKDQAAVRKATGYTGPLPVTYLTYAEALAATSCSSGTCDSATYSLDGVNYPDTTVSLGVGGNGSIAIDQATGTVLEAINYSDANDIGLLLRTRDPAKPDDPALRVAKSIKAADAPEGTNAGNLFPVVAIDEARNVYLVWATTGEDGTPSAENPAAWQIYYAWASAKTGWTKWSKPVKLSKAPANQNVMPWAVAGAEGRLAVVWYATNDATHDPEFDDIHQEWDVYLSMVSDANSSKPSAQQVKVTRHPMHYGTICFQGTGCIAQQGNRNLADFFAVTMDPRDGAVVIVYDDTSNELTQTIPGTDTQIPPPIDGIADHRGAPVVTLVKQNSGIGLLGTAIGAPAARGASIGGKAKDAVFDPIYGGEAVPEMDLREALVSREGEDLVFRIAVSTLDEPANALAATNARAVDYVVRWVGEPIDTPTGKRDPIYYAAVEVGDGEPLFFAGAARSVELCSVSGCFPHIIEYPAPPTGGTAVTGKLVSGAAGAPDHWEIRVPRDVVGGPSDTSVLESFSVFSLARNKSASLPITNVESELGISPIVVDGLCCVDTTVASGTRVLGAKTTKPAAKPTPDVSGEELPGTGVGSAPIGLALALLVGAAVTRRIVRRV